MELIRNTDPFKSKRHDMAAKTKGGKKCSGDKKFKPFEPAAKPPKLTKKGK